MNASLTVLCGARLYDAGSSVTSSRVSGTESFQKLGLWRNILNLQDLKSHTDIKQGAIWTGKLALPPAPPILTHIPQPQAVIPSQF